MQRTLVIAASAPVPRGNHVEIAQAADGTVIAVRDLDRGIQYEVRDTTREQLDIWRAVVRDCRVTETAREPRTVLVVGFSDAASAAEEALSEADAAAAAAKAESDRWGGADRQPAEAPERFW
ncbi:hypothetical protein [Microbacterium sp. AR7-10]|uniref:hypothetical protein n=1 Tax=Microbacterium sp. AR7-10 TaxID=1891970 RepID=UPI0008FC7419|nr:hypothetical protein [Microbacterium sp. AR7-10]OIU87858.1 hypothetical protein BFN01_07335 [Microbacterium sp. AR7-10]